MRNTSVVWPGISGLVPTRSDEGGISDTSAQTGRAKTKEPQEASLLNFGHALQSALAADLPKDPDARPQIKKKTPENDPEMPSVLRSFEPKKCAQSANRNARTCRKKWNG